LRTGAGIGEEREARAAGMRAGFVRRVHQRPGRLSTFRRTITLGGGAREGQGHEAFDLPAFGESNCRGRRSRGCILLRIPHAPGRAVEPEGANIMVSRSSWHSGAKYGQASEAVAVGETARIEISVQNDRNMICGLGG
jgi:hypothetical protein